MDAQQDVVGQQAHPDLFIDTGEGPEPVTIDDWNTSLARMSVLYPKTVVPVDDEARELIRREKQNPETHRLISALASRRRAGSSPRPAVTPRARESRPRARRTRSAGRDDPSEAELPPPVGGPEPRRGCRICGENVTRRRANAVYCSAACKQRSYRECQAERIEPKKILDALGDPLLALDFVIRHPEVRRKLFEVAA
jgi:hypothetical protein